MTKRTCPHPDCTHDIKLADNMTSGAYLCPCHTIKVRLVWDSYLNEAPKPRFSYWKDLPDAERTTASAD